MTWCDTRYRRLSFGPLWGCLAVATCLLALYDHAYCQSTWEVSPYRGQVWCVVGDAPNLPTAWQDQLIARLATRLRSSFRGAWSGSVVPPPKPLRELLLHHGRDLTAKQLFEAHAELSQLDKLFLVVVDGHPDGYRLRVRELDCLLARLGPMDRAHVLNLGDVVPRAAQLLEASFSPVVRIERTADKRAAVRLRAGALLRGDAAPGALAEEDILLPFDRRVRSSGATGIDDIRPVNWTYLLMRKPAATGVLEADIVSGFRQPFRAKRSRTQEQYAIRARPTSHQSIIRLRSRATEGQPLIGYEIHEKGLTNTEFLGYTDYRGELTVETSHRPIRILLVRSGDRVTAKLPIVPGLQDVVEASMLDDRQRVETDGFLSGIQIALVDLVARRESLTARIRRRLVDGDLDEAKQLFASFRRLPTEADFRQQIQQQQQALRVTDPQLRRRIDTMFVDAYRTLGEYLDPSRLRDLEREINSATAATP